MRYPMYVCPPETANDILTHSTTDDDTNANRQQRKEGAYDDYTLLSLRPPFHSTAPLQSHFDISVSLRRHLDFTSASLRCHFELTSVACQYHFDSASSSLNFNVVEPLGLHCNLGSLCIHWLRYHVELTSSSHRFHFELTSKSLRSHFEFTAIHLRVQFGYTYIGFRSNCVFSSVSLRIHIGFNIDY